MRKTLIVCMLLCGCIALFATTFAEVDLICAVCGAKNKYTVIVTTNTKGPQDLDTRPAEMMRSTIGFWVQKCPVCRYCATDVSKLLKNGKETIVEESYKAQLSNTAFPELANKYLCKMMIEDKAEEFKAAITSAMHAAWASDDAKNTTAAVAARELGVKRIEDLHARKDQYIKQTGADELLIADMLRRNEQFEKARKSAENGLGINPEETIRKILNYEITLIDNKDSAVHNIGEAQRD